MEFKTAEQAQAEAMAAFPQEAAVFQRAEEIAGSFIDPAMSVLDNLSAEIAVMPIAERFQRELTYGEGIKRSEGIGEDGDIPSEIILDPNFTELSTVEAHRAALQKQIELLRENAVLLAADIRDLAIQMQHSQIE